MNTDTVITFDGTEARRRDCRFIKGEFYIKQKQCFLINGVWYRINSNVITLDYSTNTYVLLKEHPSLVNGIVGYDIEKNELILGYFTLDPIANVDVYLESRMAPLIAMNHKILPPHIFLENLNGSGFRQSSMPGARYDKIDVTYGNHGYRFPLPYGLRHVSSDIISKVKSESESFAEKNMITNGSSGILDYVLKSSKTLIPYSFGIEFETSCGKIPVYRLLESGLVPLHDGSISGIEYVTIPLQGKIGFKTLDEACRNLRRFTKFTENDSVHLHLGGMPTTKEYIGTLYTILAILEKEFYSMFPEWYAETSKFKSRGKDYNKPLRSDLVDRDSSTTFQNIAFYLSAGKKYTGFGRPHPNDPADEHKWQVESRYHWVNFIPTLFGDSKTVEFRLHTPTDSITKVVNWILICSAILKYTEDFLKLKKDLQENRGLQLKTVINSVYDLKIATYLNDYINERKLFKRSMNDMSDYTGKAELKKSYKELV